MGNLFSELKRRNVVRVGIAYLVMGWVLIEVSDTIAPMMSLPEWAPSLVLYALILGLPVGHCHIKSASDTGIAGRDSSRRHSSVFPRIECSGTIPLERRAVDQMALKVEGIVGGGLNVEESLGGAW